MPNTLKAKKAKKNKYTDWVYQSIIKRTGLTGSLFLRAIGLVGIGEKK